MATIYDKDTETYKIKVNDNMFSVQKSLSKKYNKNDFVYDFLKIGGR